MPIILIILGAILIGLNIKAINPNKKKDFNEILEDKKDNFTDIEMQIGLMRKDIAESLTELQTDIVNIKEEINEMKHGKNIEETDNYKEVVKEEKPKEEEKVEKDTGILVEGTLSKISKVKSLMEEGFTDEEICEKLSLGKGEVLLIKGLYQK